MAPEPTPPTTGSGDLTELLAQWGEGDRRAVERLFERVYQELKVCARRQLRGERADHTLQATALVNELYLRLVAQREVRWKSRGQFFALSSRMMRRVLVDHARRRHARKRRGEKVELDEGAIAAPAGLDDADLLALDAALVDLAKGHRRVARVVELLHFGGLTQQEIAEELSVTTRTVKRDWQFGRRFLYLRLRREGSDVTP